MDQFIHGLFSCPPAEPFSFRIEMEEAAPEQVRDNLSMILVTGAKVKYGRELAALTREEIETIRKYLWSLGYDADYSLVKCGKPVLDYHPDGMPYIRDVSVNNWQITFKAANPSMMAMAAV